MKVSSIRWGVIWIGIGLFFLAINLELLDNFVFPRLFSLWPVLLIAIGVELIFKRTRLYFLALLSPLLIAGAFIWAATASGTWSWQPDEFWRGRTWQKLHGKVDVAEIMPDSAAKSLELDLNCDHGRILLTPASNVMFKATSEYFKRSPLVRHTTRDGVARIEFTDRDRPPFFISGLHLDFTENKLQVADFLPLKARIFTRNSEPDFNFAGLRLTELILDIDSKRTAIKLGRLENDVKLTVSGETENLLLTVPNDFSIHVKTDSDSTETLLTRAGFNEDSAGFLSSGSSGEGIIKLDLTARGLRAVSMTRE